MDPLARQAILALLGNLVTQENKGLPVKQDLRDRLVNLVLLALPGQMVSQDQLVKMV